MSMGRDTSETDATDLRAAYRRLREFRRGATDERVFCHPTPHPAGQTGFCFCEGALWRATCFYLKAVLLGLIFKLPFNRPKVWMLRRFGARIGRQVYFGAGTWVDPMFPELLTVEEGVFFGMGAKVFLHEFQIDQFRAGKVLIRRGAFIGAFAMIRCGVEIGEGAMVSACAAVDRDVPAGASVIGPPSRILRREESAV